MGYGLRINNLSKHFDNGQGTHRALRDVFLDVSPGEFVVVIGPNGSGKTTLLKIISGEIAPSTGKVLLVGRNIAANRSQHEVSRCDAKIARVHQDPVLGTVSNLTVLENLRLARMGPRVPSLFRFDSTKSEQAEFLNCLTKLGIQDKLEQRVSDLSHGQRQLLAIEMALMREPELLLLDEHTASLDRANAKKCLDLTSSRAQACGATVIMVTHNFQDALSVGDRLVVLREGAVAADLFGSEKHDLRVIDLFNLCGLDEGRGPLRLNGDLTTR